MAKVVRAADPDASVIPADLSFADGAPVLAAVRAGSASKSLIERYLTAYLLDASYVLELRTASSSASVSRSFATTVTLVCEQEQSLRLPPSPY